MIGLVIHPPASDFITIGRTVPAPIYYMRRSGRAARRMAWDGPTVEHGEAAKDKERERREIYRAEQRALMGGKG